MTGILVVFNALVVAGVAVNRRRKFHHERLSLPGPLLQLPRDLHEGWDLRPVKGVALDDDATGIRVAGEEKAEAEAVQSSHAAVAFLAAEAAVVEEAVARAWAEAEAADRGWQEAQLEQGVVAAAVATAWQATAAEDAAPALVEVRRDGAAPALCQTAAVFSRRRAIAAP